MLWSSLWFYTFALKLFSGLVDFRLLQTGNEFGLIESLRLPPVQADRLRTLDGSKNKIRYRRNMSEKCSGLSQTFHGSYDR